MAEPTDTGERKPDPATEAATLRRTLHHAIPGSTLNRRLIHGALRGVRWMRQARRREGGERFRALFLAGREFRRASRTAERLILVEATELGVDA